MYQLDLPMNVLHGSLSATLVNTEFKENVFEVPKENRQNMKKDAHTIKADKEEQVIVKVDK